jgi:hypothetical protein
MAALSQLSYGPVAPQCSGELVVLRPVDPVTLVVSSWPEPQRNLRALAEHLQGKEVAPIEFRAVSRERVDLVGRIGPFLAGRPDYADWSNSEQ